MPAVRRRHGLILAAALGAVAAAAPAAADAATVTVTGENGNPVAVTAAAPPVIRNMRPAVGVAFPPGEGRYTMTVTTAGGNAASRGASCRSRAVSGSYPVDYAGNGPYVITLTNFAANDFGCSTPQSSESYAFAIVAGTALEQPREPFLLREPGNFSTNVLALRLLLNPGADTHEVRFAPNATVGPDGAIAGNSAETTADRMTGVAQLRFPGPGVYTVVARPKRFVGSGQVAAPWSAPVRVVVVAPFDVSGGLRFLDSRGPSYSVRVQLRETSARGRVSVSLARGKRGGRYRSVGSARISRSGTITKRFRATRAGAYRLRFTYRGAGTIGGGRVTFPIRIARRISFG